MKPREILTQKFLLNHYVKQRKSAQTIAKECGLRCIGTVEYAIKKFGLHRESLLNSPSVFTKEFLEEHYVKGNLSMKDVAAIGGFQSNKAVAEALDRHNIPRRRNTASQKKLEYYSRRREHHTISGRYLSSLELGARSRDIPFNISVDEMWQLFVKQNGFCKLSGLPIRFNLPGEPKTMQTASLDRIDSNLGYSKKNCQWLHKDINRIKLDYNQDEFINLCRLVTLAQTK